MFVVDTNVLVYAADEDSPYHKQCLEKLDQWRRQAGAWFLTWGIVYEFLRVTTHPRVMRKPWNVKKAWGFISVLLDSPGISILSATDRHAAVAAQVFEKNPYISGNLLHDAHTAILMSEHGVSRIYTRDADFHRFSFLESIDPLDS
jgi:toxin-antitoxin system PIN domain toxin